MRALNDFFDMLKNDPARAFYGYKHVAAANEKAAIQTLLITDELFRYINSLLTFFFLFLKFELEELLMSKLVNVMSS